MHGGDADDTARRSLFRIFAFAPREGTLRWIEEELAGEPFAVVGLPTAAHLVNRLKDQQPRSIAIVDFDAIDNDEVKWLQLAREHGWSGTLIGLGNIDRDTRVSLRVHDVISRPLGSERLRKALTGLLPRDLDPIIEIVRG